jgi:hypothetical protein
MSPQAYLAKALQSTNMTVFGRALKIIPRWGAEAVFARTDSYRDGLITMTAIFSAILIGIQLIFTVVVMILVCLRLELPRPLGLGLPVLGTLGRLYASIDSCCVQLASMMAAGPVVGRRQQQKKEKRLLVLATIPYLCAPMIHTMCSTSACGTATYKYIGAWVSWPSPSTSLSAASGAASSCTPSSPYVTNGPNWDLFWWAGK